MRNAISRFGRFVVNLWKTSPAFAPSVLISAFFTAIGAWLSPTFALALGFMAGNLCLWVGVLLIAFAVEPREPEGDGR
jgi:hypothetical protein